MSKQHSKKNKPEGKSGESEFISKEKTVNIEFPDGGESIRMTRRDFLRVAAVSSAATAISVSACESPVEKIVPFVERPEEMRLIGKPLFYSTAIGQRPALVRTREGRPILVEPNRKHPASTATTLQAQAAILDLYDPDRARHPYLIGRGRKAPVATAWENVSREAVKSLKSKNGKVAILSGNETGPATLAAIEEFCKAFGGVHVHYHPYEKENAAKAWAACFGSTLIPKPCFDRAKLIIGFGAEFLDFGEGDSQRHFIQSRNPDSEDMSRFIAFEGRLSLTGANADRRIRVRPSQLPLIAKAIARELIVERKLGLFIDETKEAGNGGNPAYDGSPFPLLSREKVAAVLVPFTFDKVAKTSGIDKAVLMKIADDLAGAKGSSIVIGGASSSAQADGAALETSIILINYVLGNYGGTFDLSSGTAVANGGINAVKRLVSEMKNGKVKLLLIHGANPVYDLPESIGIAEAMGEVGLVISMNDRIDETSRYADFLAPASHAFESWSDVAFSENLYGIRQPTIRPLYDTQGFLDLLISWGALAGAGGGLASAFEMSGDVAESANGVSNSAYHYIRARWKEDFFTNQSGDPGFEAFWNETLRRGYFRKARAKVSPLILKNQTLGELASDKNESSGGLEIEFFPHFALYDGASANNGWLLEVPDPITRITWGDWVALAPRRFDEMGLENGDLLEISLDGKSISIPAYRQAGMHYDVLAVPLGYGREAVGEVGNDIGRNFFRLLRDEDGRLLRSGIPVSMKKAGGNETLAITQGCEVLDREARPIVPVTTLEAYRKNPKSGTEQPFGDQSIKNKPIANFWFIAIDLNKCIGCGQCTIACQAENNIPVVGKKGVIEGREMSWIRVDRYYEAPRKVGVWPDNVWDGPLEVVEEPKTLFEPMLCQHCQNAPCESVCPVGATGHSESNINGQVYSRCIGTRFCANNCPFKVRRFNWFEYSKERSSLIFRLLAPEMERHSVLNVRGEMKMKNNPEVNVRSRGVMEKCQFCVQRIDKALLEQRIIKRENPKLVNLEYRCSVPDDVIKTACQEACPTGAILVGDVKGENSEIFRLRNSPRAMKLMEHLNLDQSISYLTKVRNES